MQDKNEAQEKTDAGYTGRGQGMQGIDKAPGEETSQGASDTIREAQKGKNKVDGDPSKESDQPLDQSSL